MKRKSKLPLVGGKDYNEKYLKPYFKEIKEEVIQLNKEGYANKDIAEKLGVNSRIVSKYLRKPFTEREEIKYVVELNQQGYTNEEIVEELGNTLWIQKNQRWSDKVTESNVYLWLKKSGLKNFTEKQEKDYKKLQDIIELHNQGSLNKDISKNLGVSNESVSYYLRKLGLVKNLTEKQEKKHKRLQDIVELNQQGLIDSDIAACFGIYPITVRKVLDKVGLENNLTGKQEKRKQHYQNNKEELMEKQRSYYQENKEEEKEKRKKYYQKNQKKIKEQKKEYYQNNKYKIKKKREGHLK